MTDCPHCDQELAALPEGLRYCGECNVIVNDPLPETRAKKAHLDSKHCTHPNTDHAPGMEKASVWCPDCREWVLKITGLDRQNHE